MDPYIYLLLNAGTISIPFIASFYSGHPFYKRWRHFLLASFPVAAAYILWDAAFTDMGVWGFNEKYLIGLSLFGLPLEEVLFFLCIPFACTFTFFAMGYFFKLKAKGRNVRQLSIVLLIAFGVLALLFKDKWYTATAMWSCALFFGFVAWYKWEKLPLFILTYAICLIPFYIVNGVLTGTFISEQVVWYNDFENLGSRILTVPLDDLFYSLSLQGFNIIFFDRLGRKKNY